MNRMAAVMVMAGLIVLPACNLESPAPEAGATPISGGDAARGRMVIEKYGCASCHTIPGIPGDANTGPPLDRIGSRVYIAGVLLNTPDNMLLWLRDPPTVDPKTAMPDVGATDDELRDIAAYLYTLR